MGKPYMNWLLENGNNRYAKMIALIYKDKKFPRGSSEYDDIRDYIDSIDPHGNYVDDFEESWDEYLEEEEDNEED
jgi:uncharacterized protein YozE (UPF0346 family)